MYVVICLTALLTSLLTLFSGFGLGTVLMPVFAIFFPLPVAIAATAVVHLANNIFKLAIVGKYADGRTVLKFGLPAAIAAILGAYLLNFFAEIPPLFSYHLASHRFDVKLASLVIGLIVIFAGFCELFPSFSQLSFNKKYLIPGGLLSGFFGGLSGYQGILRSAFLIKAGLTKEQFIGTGIICSVMVDVARLIVYGLAAYTKKFSHLPPDMLAIILAASVAAFIGAYLGARLMKKVTFPILQIIVAGMLIILGLGMVLGFINSS